MKVLFCACLTLMASFPLLAADDGSRQSVFQAPLPEYTYPHKDGLYATIAGYLSVPKVSLENEHGYKLKVPGFEKKMPVKAVVQKQNAPLVVILLGIGGHTDADFSQLWASWYEQAGYHVLYFDSTFRPPFVEISGHGVTGNLWAESERIAAIIETFMDEKDIRGKITQVGVVGMSYGATQALILGQMAREGKLPFQLASIQAYSPPLRLELTAAILDKWHDEERWKYTLTELQSKIGKRPEHPTDVAPFSASMMKAAIAASFRTGLPDVIVRNDEHFELNLLPRGEIVDDHFVRKQAAENWGYSQFAFDMALPYWEARLGRSAIDTLIHRTQLIELLAQQPAYSETILAADDPFNLPEELERLKASSPRRLTMLPHGGHLGYVAEAWTRAKLLTLFSERPEPVLAKRWE